MFASDTTTHKTPPTNPLRTFFGFLLKVLLRVYVVVFVSLGFFKSFFKGFVSLFRCFVDYCITCFICRCVVVSYISFHISLFVLLCVCKRHITPHRQTTRKNDIDDAKNGIWQHKKPPKTLRKLFGLWGVCFMFGGVVVYFVFCYYVFGTPNTTTHNNTKNNTQQK